MHRIRRGCSRAVRSRNSGLISADAIGRETRVLRDLRRHTTIATDRDWKVGFSEMLSLGIRRVAARNLVATLFGIAILSVIPRSGRAQDIVGSARLRALVDEALARSPVVLTARSHWQAQTKVPIQASTLPDPQVSLQHFTVGSPQPFSGYESSDFYYSGFGIAQEIPGPGKLRLQKAEAEKDAEFAKHRYEVAERDVEERIKEIYFELFYHRRTLEILDRNQDELQQIQQIAEAILAGLLNRLYVRKDRPQIPRLLHAEPGRQGPALFLAQADASNRAGSTRIRIRARADPGYSTAGLVGCGEQPGRDADRGADHVDLSRRPDSAG